MADDIRLSIGITGTEKVIEATNKTLGLESSVKKLSSAYARDGLTYGKYRKGLGELASTFGRTEAELRKYANALRAADAAGKRSKAATDAEIASLKAYRQARREATEENRRFNAEAKNASKVVSDAVKAALQAEIAALKSYKQARREATEENIRFNVEARKAAQTSSMVAAKTEELKNANRRLRMEFKEGYAAQVQFRMAVLRLNQALSQGVVSSAQHAAQLTRLRTALDNAGGAAQRGGRHMSRSGVITQQAGYQVGDFLVQVQGGTNVMVAFGQQATQLVGALYMLPTATLAAKVGLLGLSFSVATLIAAMGIIIPLVTAVVAAWMRAGGAAKKVNKDFENLSSAVSAYKSAVDEANESSDDMGKTFGRFSTYAKEAILALREIKKIKLSEGITAAVNSVGISVDKISGKISSLQNNIIRDFLTLKGGIGDTSTKVALFVNSLKALESAEGIDSQISSAKSLSDTLLTLSGPFKDMTLEQKTLYEGLQEFIREASKLGEAAADVKLYSDNMEAAAEAEKERSEAVKEIRKTLAEELIVQAERKALAEASIALLAVEMQYGKESAQYKKLEAEYARAAYAAEQVKEGVLGNNLKKALEAYDAATKTVKAADDAAVSFSNWSGSIGRASSALSGVLSKVNAIFSAINSVGFETIGIQAETAALKAGKTAAQASVEGEYAQTIAEIESGPKTGIYAATAGLSKAAAAELRDAKLAKAAVQAEQDKFTSTAGGSSGSSGGGGKTPDDPVKKLQEQLDLQRELIGKSEEYITVRNALGDSYSKIEPAQIANLQAQVVAIEAMKQAEADRKAIVDTVADSIGSGLTSIVDGTKSVKDAFKDMARAVISELWKVFVVQKLVAGVKTLFGFADGGVFSGGAVDKKYASGGVVGGPTTFPMAGGKTGLMGEAGPEAIMPLKRGKNGKLGVSAEGGGSQNVTVVQNFNFQANGDESVKKIIAQAAPSISAMAQKGMMDQRRRGGSMKSTFG